MDIAITVGRNFLGGIMGILMERLVGKLIIASQKVEVEPII